MHTSNTSIAVLVAWIVATLCQAFVSRAESHIKVTRVDRVIFVPFIIICGLIPCMVLKSNISRVILVL